MTLMRCKQKFKPIPGVSFEMYFIRALRNTYTGILNEKNKIFKNELVLIRSTDNTDSLDAFEQIEVGESYDIGPAWVDINQSMSKELTSEAKELFNVLISSPSELFSMSGGMLKDKIRSKDLAQFLRKEEHGSKWSSAKISQIKRTIKGLIFQTT